MFCDRKMGVENEEEDRNWQWGAKKCSAMINIECVERILEKEWK